MQNGCWGEFVMTNGEQIRAFIAIELPEKLRQQLSHIQSQLKKNTGIDARWVNPYGIHLTLIFLGNVTPPRIEAINNSMSQATQGTVPFQLEMKGIGVFPNLNKIQVIWVGIGGETEILLNLQRRLQQSMTGLGFTPENRAFTPHLTLARARDRIPQDQVDKLARLISAGIGEPFAFQVKTVDLMRSQLTPQGAIYTRLFSAGSG